MENKTPSAAGADTQAQTEIQPFVYDAEVCEDMPPKLRLAEETTRQTIQLLNFIQQQMNHTVINK